MKKFALWCALCATTLAADAPRFPLFPGTDGYSRPITTRSTEVQRYFDQGLGLLYGFDYDDALRSFQAAAQIDPDCAFAWWGVAAACGPNVNNPRVSPERTQVALEALQHARTAANASPVERTLIEAQAARYSAAPTATRASLDAAYAAAMRAVWGKFPQDADVGALFTESLMDLYPWDQWTFDGQPKEGTLELVATVERVLALAPNHPQALHLYIHAYEGSREPAKAADAANRLRNLLPGVAHMMHMPSHIDVLVGRWDEAVVANEKAVAVDASVRASGGTTRGNVWMLNAHHRHMLAFAAMMSGRSELALRTMHEMAASWPEKFPEEFASRMDPYYAMPMEVMVRFGRWDEILARPLPDASLPTSRALAFAARGIAHAAKGEIDAARAEQREFFAAVEKVPADAHFWNSRARDLLGVAAAMLDGEVLFRAGQTNAGLGRLRDAVEAERRLVYDEPPNWIIPVRHALGAALLQVGRVQEAEQVYRDDLARWPGNGWSLFGLSRALKLQHRAAEAAAAEKLFRAAWTHADIELKSSCLCQPGV